MNQALAIKSPVGRWAVGLGIAFFAATALSVIFALAIGGDATVVESRASLSIVAHILALVFTLAGPLSFLVGIYALIKNRERAVAKFLALLYFLSFIMFLAGEFLFPH